MNKKEIEGIFKLRINKLEKCKKQHFRTLSKVKDRKKEISIQKIKARIREAKQIRKCFRKVLEDNK